ncbi:hypothetical protein Q3G72_006523 [Acer saccharum]|nr:hypothetical protein Q3G72_006523 [Acer saccharum]
MQGSPAPAVTESESLISIQLFKTFSADERDGFGFSSLNLAKGQVSGSGPGEETREANGSDNLVLREEQVRTVTEEEKRRLQMVRRDSDEECNRTIAEIEDKLRQARRSAGGSCQGEKQISRSKLNGSSSHGMRTRKSMARGALRDQQMVQSGTVEDEVGKVMAVGPRIGVDFSEVEDEVLVKITRREEKRRMLRDLRL